MRDPKSRRILFGDGMAECVEGVDGIIVAAEVSAPLIVIARARSTHEKAMSEQKAPYCLT